MIKNLPDGFSSIYGCNYWPNQPMNKGSGDFSGTSLFPISNPFVSSPFDDHFCLSPLGPDSSDFDFLNNDLFYFDMLMNNQMPLYLQNGFFTNSYNTQSDLSALKGVYDPDSGSKLANIAETNARITNTIGWCAGGTNNALELAGLATGETRVQAAYQEADVLANHPNFKEVNISRNDLGNLPAGCIIVWDKCRDNNRINSSTPQLTKQYGHILVTLGKDSRGVPQEASDHKGNLLIFDDLSYRVFVPVGKKKLDKKT